MAAPVSMPCSIAFEHVDKGHPHVHVVAGGYAGGNQVGIYERDLRWLSQTADRSKEALSRQRQALEVELNHFLDGIFRAVPYLGRKR